MRWRGPRVSSSVPPEVLEAIRREGGVAHGRSNRPMAQVVLDRARVVAIVGEPQNVWTEMRRPGPHHHGEIAEGFYIVVDGNLHLADSLGKAIPGYSDIAGIDPMARARKLLRTKALRDRPDEFWGRLIVPGWHGGWEG